MKSGKLFHSLALAISLIFISGHAKAQLSAFGLYVKADVEAGLDAETRKLIQQLPESIRKEIIILLNEAKPIIDKAFKEYLGQLTTSYSKMLAETRCQTQGTLEQFLDYVLAKTKFWKSGQSYVSGYLEWVEEKQQSFSKHTTISEFASEYADLATDGTRASCIVKLTPIATEMIASQFALVDMKARVWLRAKNNGCTQALPCIESSTARIQKILETGNPLDEKKIGGMEKLQQISKSTSELASAKFSASSYEDLLVRLNLIEDSHKNAKLFREAETLENEVASTINSLEASANAANLPMRVGEDAMQRGLASIANATLDKPILLKKIDDAISKESGKAIDKDYYSNRIDLINRHAEGVRAHLRRSIQRWQDSMLRPPLGQREPH